jgi:hypothetical protein
MALNDIQFLLDILFPEVEKLEDLADAGIKTQADFNKAYASYAKIKENLTTLLPVLEKEMYGSSSSTLKFNLISLYNDFDNLSFQAMSNFVESSWKDIGEVQNNIFEFRELVDSMYLVESFLEETRNLLSLN